jgi:LacI family transcriptional regulator
MATIKDVSREAGVSVASVSRALNGHRGVTPETTARIREIATRLRYVPHVAARSLITRRTHTIGALLPDLHGEFFSELIRGIDLAARARGLHLLVSSSHDSSEEAAAALRAMQGRVDGLLILSPRIDAAFLHANLPDQLPAVLLNSAVRDRAYDTLNIDDYAGAYAMTRHLLRTGHPQVTFVGGPEGNFDAQERERGYRDAMAQHALGVAADVVPGDFSEESGQAAADALLRRAVRPRAVFAANDMMAVGCMYAFKDAGLRIPEDVALAGFDDIPIVRYLSPPLTTVHVRIADFGRSALERLAGLLAPAEATAQPAAALDCEVVVRGSCGANLTITSPA